MVKNILQSIIWMLKNISIIYIPNIDVSMLTTKEDIIAKVRQDIATWGGFRSPQPGTAGSLGLGRLKLSFSNQKFPTGVFSSF